MKGNTSIWYLSRCENPRCKNPYHCVPVHAVIDTKELPDKCECGGRLTWEAGVHQHNIESIKRKSKINKVNVIVWAVSILLVLAITGAIITPYVLAHREYSDEEMAAAVKETAGRSIDDILTQLNRDKDVAKLLGVSPYVVQRLRTGTTTATPAMAALLRGVYCQYVLNKRSWLITRMQVGVTRGATDMYYAFPDPHCEIE